MAKYIHNISLSTKTYEGREITSDSYFLIPPPLYKEFSQNSSLIDDITNGDILLSRDGTQDLETIENSLALLKDEDIRSSIALDKEGIDQYIEGDSPVVITSDRVLWDLNEDYDINNDNFLIPIDGIYFFDCQIKITDLSNVSSVEIALYKRGTPDDYWFILDKKEVGSLSEIQMAGATSFDFYTGEEYTLKIILTKTISILECSCTISGNDDYTAWGYSIKYPF